MAGISGTNRGPNKNSMKKKYVPYNKAHQSVEQDGVQGGRMTYKDGTSKDFYGNTVGGTREVQNDY